MTRWSRFVGIAACVGLLAVAGGARADGFEPACSRSNVDLSATRVFANGQPGEFNPDDLWDVLGLAARPADGRWSAGTVAASGGAAAGGGETEFVYILAFRKPVEIGSILLQGAATEVAYLASGKAAPAEQPDDAAWQSLPFTPVASGGVLITPPDRTKTQALRIVDRRSSGRSDLRSLRLLAGRYQNVAPAALAYARHEYTPPMSPYTQAAALVTAGTGAWNSSGKDDRGQVSTPPITDINPEWFLLAWDEPRSISGLWLSSNVAQWTLDTFAGPDEINPRVGTDDEWRRVRKLTETRDAGRRWIALDPPVVTRGLRLNITQTDETPQIATIDGLHALVALGDEPAAELKLAAATQPPFRFPVEVPTDGNLTLAVDAADGTRARNVLARVPATAGTSEQAWDLKDERGHYVAPGEYRWSAITLPELQTRYEFTVYPNVRENSPENAPWLTGVNGPGGWLADHTPNQCVCAVGDSVFLGAYVAESGVSLIECDLTGRKLWGHHSFAAWTGPKLLASDGRTLFVGSQVLNTTGDMVWGVDLATKEVRPVIDAPPTAARARGLVGMAAHEGRLYLSVRGQEDWLAGAATADDVDLQACQPVYREARKPRVAYEIVANPRDDFLRLFRLAPHPPGHGIPGSLTYLQTPKGAGPRQHIVLAFQRPVPVGSVVFPRPTEPGLRVEFSVLRPDAPFPPQADREKWWQPFESAGTATRSSGTATRSPGDEKIPAWDVLAAPAETLTRALRITLAKGDATDPDDLLATVDGDDAADPLDRDAAGDAGPASPDAGDEPFDLDSATEKDSAAAKKKRDLTEFGENAERWIGQLEGLKLLRRRFENLFAAGQVRVNSGTLFDDGSWDAQRDRPLTADDPGIYGIEWSSPQTVRGLAIKEIDGKLTKVDVYTGGDGPIDISAMEGWEEVAQYEQGRRDVGNGYGLGLMNPHSRYVDGYVDFGRTIETRAVRLRIVEQWADNGQAACMGIRQDLGAGTLDPTRCRVWGVAPLAYVGGEAAVDARSHQRIEVYDPSAGKLLEEIPLADPGPIAFDSEGRLHVLAGGKIVRVDPTGGQATPLVTDLESPTDLAFDVKGHLYVFDAGADRHTVRVYNAKGKHLRSIGEPGGFRAGAWDPRRMGDVIDIDVDQQGQLWVVESQYWPKRITLWSTDGTFQREFLGNTAYGGGGVLDPWDKTRLFYGPLEFELNWETGRSRLKNLTWLPGWNAGETPIHIEDHLYLVTRPQFSEMQCGIVYLYEQDHLKLAAAMGPAVAFDPLKRADITAPLGGTPLTALAFTWSDRDDDGQVDAEEVVFMDKPEGMYGLSAFNRDLGVQAGATRWSVKEFLPSGVPIYEVQRLEDLADRCLYRLDDGDYYRLGDGSIPEARLTAAGAQRWTYTGEGAGVQALQNARPWRTDQVVSQFGIVGHETAPAGDLGEFLVIHGNTGAWNLWTADGLLVGPLFRDLRDPRAVPWSMTGHERGMAMTNLNSGQEHFSGWVCRSRTDNRFYAVAGHNHISVLEVQGLDQARRAAGTFQVTTDDIEAAQDWERRKQQRNVYARSPVLDCYRADEPPEIDGKLDDWSAPSAEIDRQAEFRMMYDDEFLFLAWRTQGLGPLKNTGQQWDRLFKSGAAVDLQIGIDPAAELDRQAPVAGDQRLLLTLMADKPAAVLYRAVVPGTPEDQAWRVVSPVDAVTFDQVEQVRGVHLATTGDNGGYIVEAAVPLAALGLEPVEGLRLKLDWGLLVTGPEGHEVLRRVYWSNKATAFVADAPSEARLHPNLWGFARFHAGKRPSAEDALDAIADGDEPGAKKDVKKDVTDILDELDEK